MNRCKMPMMLRFLLVLTLALPSGLALAADGEEEKKKDEGGTSLDTPVVAGFDDLDAEGKKDATVEPAEIEGVAPDQPAGSMNELHLPLRFYSASPGGEAGLVRVHEAFAGPPMSMRLSMHGGFFTSSSFLNYLDETDYSQQNIQGRLGLSITPIEYLEVFLGLRSTSNKNSSSRPGLLQTQGDLSIGAKGIYPVLPYLGVGLDAAVTFTNGIGDVSPAFDATNFRTALMLSFDARGLDRDIPLRVHLNAGFILENTEALEGNRELTWTEQYALGVNGFHRVALGFGIDAPLPYAHPVAISPFLEFTTEIPIGISNDDLVNSSLGDDASLANIVPVRLTPGVRFSYMSDITLDVAVDIGLGGEKAYLDGVPSTPPWTVWIGLAYAFDPTQSGGPGAPDPALLAGKVSNRADGSVLGGATITFAGVSSTPVASDFSAGRYSAKHDTEGTIMVTCSKDGYMPETHEILIERGEQALLDFALEPDPKEEVPPPGVTGKVVGRVINVTDQMPITHAIISFNGAGLTPVATDDLEGKYATYELPPGVIKLTAVKDGFKPLAQEVDVKLGETTILDFALESAIKLATLSGTVTDHKDKPLVAQVQIDGPTPANLASAQDTGVFATETPVGSYVVKVTAEGFMAKARRFELKENQNVMAEFKLSPRPKRKVVILQVNKKKIAVRRKIHFESGKTDLKANSHQILDGVVDILVTHPEVKRLRIEGHTDSVGSNKLNERLSQGRAESVMGYLIGQGIDAGRIEAKGYGEVKPIAPNSSRRGRVQNRRVDFTILELAK
jgi:outer membrane protein OmpA-like peptidoglycan-associated protein